MPCNLLLQYVDTRHAKNKYPLEIIHLCQLLVRQAEC